MKMSETSPFYSDPTFWVAGSFIVFVLLIIYGKAHKAFAQMLDAHAQKIGDRIEESQKLRDEAEKLLRDYQRRQREAEKEAVDIIAQAKTDADLFAKQAEENFALLTKRRQKRAADKIEQVRTAAVREVQALAVDYAIQAAENVLKLQLEGKKGAALIDDTIAEVKKPYLINGI